MNRKPILMTLLAGALLLVAVAGCGTQASNGTANTTPNKNTTVSNSTVVQKTSSGGTIDILGASQYAGAANLSKYEMAARSNPHNAEDLINAAISSHVNGKNQQAIAYYKAAIKAEPTSGVAYTSLGNIYFENLSNPKVALTYYNLSTSKDPRYGYGWLLTSMAQQSLHNITAAKAAVSQGLKVVSTKDPAYKQLEGMQALLNKPDSSAANSSNGKTAS